MRRSSGGIPSMYLRMPSSTICQMGRPSIVATTERAVLVAGRMAILSLGYLLVISGLPSFPTAAGGRPGFRFTGARPMYSMYSNLE